MKKYALLVLCLVVLAAIPGALSLGSTPGAAQAAVPQAETPGDLLASMASNWVRVPAEDEKPVELPQSTPGKVAYLTFDDGPDPLWTPQVLKVLNQYGAKATFYVLGRSVKAFPEVVRELAASGQTFGNHSYNHAHIAFFGYGDFFAEINDTKQAVEEALAGMPGTETLVTQCLRPPYGEVSPSLYNNAAQMGYALSFWQIDTRDWAKVPPASIVQQVAETIEPEKTILMHDGGEDRQNTVEALQLVLHELTMQGYSFPPLCTSDGQATTHP